MRKFSLMFAILSLTLILWGGTAYAAQPGTQDEFMWGCNCFKHQYSGYATNPARSFLVPVDGGYMRVQSGDLLAGNDSEDFTDDGIESNDVVGVEYYDQQFNRVGNGYRLIDKELPLWGGFYAYGDYYYIVSGQSNTEESDAKEVYRLTKYDKSWNRVGSVGLYGANTSEPFVAGSCAIEASGSNLIVHTCHHMYTYTDGQRHQSNATFVVDVDQMKVLKDRTTLGGAGYVSHSFNQFMHIDGDRIIAVDHGDAYPRSIVLTKYNEGSASGTISSSKSKKTDVLPLTGDIGDNKTGAELGGFQISDSSYLIAGTSKDQSSADAEYARNIFVGAVDRESGAVSMNWHTVLPESKGGPFASNPYLVKINGDRFLLLWNESSADDDVTIDNAYKRALLRALFVNGKGEAVSGIYDLKGALSDCEPVVSGDQVVWYAYNGPQLTFYQLPLSDPNQLQKTFREWKIDPTLIFKNSKKNVKYKKLKTSAQKIWALNLKCSVSDLSYSGKGINAKSKKALKINKKNGMITVKKNTRKGTYKMKVTVKTKASKLYRSVSGSAIVTIRVR